MKKYIAIVTFLVSSFAFSQSPWTQEKGKYYTQLSFTTLPNYTDLFGDPDYSTFGEITDNTVQLYGEYGLTDRTTVLLNLPFKLISINDFQSPLIDCSDGCPEDFNESQLGNIEVGIRHNFYNNKWILSGQLAVELNTASYDAVSGIRTGYDAFTLTPLFLAGRSFGKTYIQSSIGAQIRTNDYSSNFKVGGEVGHKITKHIWLIGFVDVVKSFENGTVALPIQNTFTGLYVNDQEYGAYGFKGIGEITEKFGVTASYGGAFFGNNVPKQAAINFGIFQKF